MPLTHAEKIEALRRQGVTVCAPETIEIGDEVDLSRVHGPNTVLHTGTKLYGADLLISSGTRIGFEEPVTVDNCALGRDVQLKGGYYADAVFLDRASMGAGAHVRGGTLLEEEANGAHTVGLKQTLLLPFVTLGSLINFCDILMAGGTSRKDHSEVGSSFIHFNYTPFGENGDKATPSLIGDIPRGVMLRSARIFLGGQAGLVGPLHIDYGTVLAAGFVYRRDHGPDELVVGEPLHARTFPFNPRRYTRIRAKVQKNLQYIGNLTALWHWYETVRRPLAGADPARVLLWDRAQDAVAACIKERVKRLGQIAGYMEASIGELEPQGPSNELDHQRAFAQRWPELEARLLGYRELEGASATTRATLSSGVSRAADATGGDYLKTIGTLEEAAVAAGTAWLDELVNEVSQVPF